MDLLKYDQSYQDLNCWLNVYDIASLEGWLTDNVIQFFGEIIEKNFALKISDIHISILHPVATVFIRSNPQSVLEHLHLAEKHWIFCPIYNSPKYENQGNHWSLLVISRDLNLSLYLDSLLPSKANIQNPTFEVKIAQETSDIICGFCKWATDFRIIPCLQQSNAHDCGIYVILYMCWICHFLIEDDLKWIDSGLTARQMRHDAFRLRSYLRDEINLYLRSRASNP
uniref:Sentrin specific protease 8 n=1 Tax=Echinococcus granulosus TaxID=6210 RepID=A0A068WJY2_ECHGR|nr:sentrin specific protease 8 [Echinococcus granulosus]